MRNEEVKVGAVYIANVSGKKTAIKIIRKDNHGYGWHAENLKTGRVIRIKSGRRLLRLLAEAEGNNG